MWDRKFSFNLRSHNKSIAILPPRNSLQTPCLTYISWEKQLNKWFELNVDGASFGYQGKAEGGGLIRHSNGHWVVGFSRS